MTYTPHPLIKEFQEKFDGSEIELPMNVVLEVAEVTSIYQTAKKLEVDDPEAMYLLDYACDIAQAVLRGLMTYEKSSG